MGQNKRFPENNCIANAGQAPGVIKRYTKNRGKLSKSYEITT